MKALKIWWLKRRLKREYLIWCTHADYGCGNFIRGFVRPRVHTALLRVNETLDKLEALGEVIPAKLHDPYTTTAGGE